MQGEQLYCTLCGVFVNDTRASGVRQHIWGSQVKNEDEQRRLEVQKVTKHLQKRDAKKRNENRESGTVKSFYQSNPSSRRKKEIIEWRVKVTKGFLVAGIPFNKLKKKRFGSLLGSESGQPSLDSPAQLDELIPSIIDSTFKDYIFRLRDAHVAVCFDGGKLNHTVDVTLVTFVENYTIQTLLIGMKRTERSLDHKALAYLVTEHLSRVGIKLLSVVFVNSDRASVCIKAAKELNPPALLREANNRRDLSIHIGCFCHTLNNAGLKMRKGTRELWIFTKSWNKMVSTSASAATYFKEKYGVRPKSYSATRWWSWWEIVVFLKENFACIPQFLRVMEQKKWSTKSVTKMLDVIRQDNEHGRWRLEMQIYVTVNAGRFFCTTSYLLETKGFIAPFVFGLIQRVFHNTQDMREGAGVQEAWEFWDRQFQKYSRAGMQAHPFLAREDLSKGPMISALKAAENMFQYFFQAFWNKEEKGSDGNVRIPAAEMRGVVDLFRICSIFNPYSLFQKFEAGFFNQQDAWYNALKCLSSIRGISDALVQTMLTEVGDLRTAIYEFNDFCPDFVSFELKQKVEVSWKFWCDLEKDPVRKAPSWWKAVKVVALLHPASVRAEVVFSIGKGNVNKTQHNLKAEKQEIGLILAANDPDGDSEIPRGNQGLLSDSDKE